MSVFKGLKVHEGGLGSLLLLIRKTKSMPPLKEKDLGVMEIVGTGETMC